MLWVQAVLQEVLTLVVISSIGAFLVTPFCRELLARKTFWSVWRIAFWAFARGVFMIIGLYFIYIVILQKQAHETPALGVVAMMVFTGWLVHNDLKAASVSSKAPGPTSTGA